MPFDFYSAMKYRQLGEVSSSFLSGLIEDYRISRYDQDTATQVHSVHEGDVNCLSLDPTENRYLLSCGADGRLGLYDVYPRLNTLGFQAKGLTRENPQEYKWRSKHTGAVRVVDWYPFDTGLFFSGGADAKIGVWDTNEMRMFMDFTLNGPILAAAMSSVQSNSALIAAGSRKDYNIKLCDIRSGSSSHTLVGHTNCVSTVAWSRTHSHQLASGSYDGTIRLWDVRRPGALVILDQHNDMKSSLSASSSSHYKANTSGASSHADGVVHVDFTPDGLSLMSYGLDRRFHLWDLSTCCNTFRNYSLTDSRNLINRFCFSKNGTYMFTGSNRTVRICNMETGDVCGSLRGHFDVVTSVVYNPDSGDVFSAGKDGMICVWTAQVSKTDVPLQPQPNIHGPAQAAWFDDEDDWD